MSSFGSIPILDLSLARNPASKSAFLHDLRHALLEVGFLYIKNTGIRDELIEQVVKEGRGFFDLPIEEKLKIEMKNAPSFLGYSQLNAEITAYSTDHREQIDLSTPHPLPTSTSPLHHNLLAPNQWPSHTHLPSFRPVFEEYISLMSSTSIFFTSLIAEAIGLPADAFHKFFERDQQHKLKIVKYPDVGELGLEGEGQGVGPHKDSMLSSYLLQASEHRGLQAQNSAGEWIDCPPIPGTLVVAIGQGLEALTEGVCASTTHRVLSPPAGSGPRFSIPFFQGVSLDAEFEGLDLDAEIPEEVREMRRKVVEANGGRLDDVEFMFRRGKYKCLGEATLRNRIKSHQDVGERWYPDLLKQIRADQEEQRRKAKGGVKVIVGSERAVKVVGRRTAVDAH